MSLMIDTPRWPWRGMLWAHMISDHSLEELHDAARALNLRWVAFGRDHYDVPDVLWPAACELAELVDPREIVRSLRRTGLRVPGGKPKKSWRQLDGLPQQYRSGEIADWLRMIATRFDDDTAIEVLVRPTELVVLHLRRSPEAPALDALADAPLAARLVHTISDDRYSLEVVLPWSE